MFIVFFETQFFQVCKRNRLPNKATGGTSKSEKKKMNQNKVPNWAKAETQKTRVASNQNTQKNDFRSALMAPQDVVRTLTLWGCGN